MIDVGVLLGGAPSNGVGLWQPPDGVSDGLSSLGFQPVLIDGVAGPPSSLDWVVSVDPGAWRPDLAGDLSHHMGPSGRFMVALASRQRREGIRSLKAQGLVPTAVYGASPDLPEGVALVDLDDPAAARCFFSVAALPWSRRDAVRRLLAPAATRTGLTSMLFGSVLVVGRRA
jgi:hypothetical protein